MKANGKPLRKRIFALVLALGMGLASGAIVTRISNRKSAAAEREKTVKVVVMKRPLGRGVKLKGADMGMKDWPERLVSPEYIREAASVRGRVLIADVVKGEPLVQKKLAPENSVEGLSMLIPSGRRAFTVRVNDFTGVGGFLLPGSRVDVLTTIDMEAETKKGAKRVSLTKTVLQNVEVLAAGEKMEAGSKKGRISTSVVTLLLTPKQGEKLTLAATKGSIWLSMRNPRDWAQIESAPVSVGDMMRKKKEERRRAVVNRSSFRPPRLPRRKKKRAGRYTVEIFHGSERTTVDF